MRWPLLGIVAVAGAVDLDALLAGLSLEDKARELDMVHGCDELIADGRLRPSARVEGGVVHDLYPPGDRGIVNALQANRSVPLLFVEECLHGVEQHGKTVFPQSLALAASWDAELVEEVGAAIGAEARAYGIHQCFSPVLGLARDPRWGRVEETLGEDPRLTGDLGAAMVRGMQHGGVLAGPEAGVIAEPKHFAAHSVPEGGSNKAPVSLGSRELDEFLEPFRRAVSEAGALGIMCAYSELDGVPNCANDETLTAYLREEWGFEGWVLADDGAVRMLWDTHGVASSPADAVAQFLTAGGNVQYYDFPHAEYQAAIVESVRNGSLAEAVVDARVREMLAVKERLGLFEDARVDPAWVRERVDSPAHRRLARRAAAESLVLLENDGLLPLPPATVGTYNVAVIGPSADVVRTGDYSGSGVPANFATVLEALTADLGPLAFHPGCYVAASVETLVPVRPMHFPDGGLRARYFDRRGRLQLERRDLAVDFDWYVYGPVPALGAAFSVEWTGTLRVPLPAQLSVDANGDPFELLLDGRPVPADTAVDPGDYELRLTYNRTDDGQQHVRLLWDLVGGDEDASIAAAAALAARADAVVLVLGENDQTVGESEDRASLQLPGRQNELVDAVLAAGTPVAAVLLHGRPLAVQTLKDGAAAVMQSFFPGQAGGRAVADALLGRANPGGRLPITFPASVGQIPIYAAVKPSRLGHDYVFQEQRPLWPLGHGRSYTSFAYSALEVGPAGVSFTVTNNGSRAGDEVPQLYLRDVVSSVTTPVRQLRGFRRLRDVQPGEARRVHFPIEPMRDLSLLNRTMQRVVEPGWFDVEVGWCAAEACVELEGSFYYASGLGWGA